MSGGVGLKRWLAMAVCGVACVAAEAADGPLAVAVSPDGHNEIRLWRNPLRYDVRRDGVTLVAATPVGLRVNGRELADGARARGVTARIRDVGDARLSEGVRRSFRERPVR